MTKFQEQVARFPREEMFNWDLLLKMQSRLVVFTHFRSLFQECSALSKTGSNIQNPVTFRFQFTFEVISKAMLLESKVASVIISSSPEEVYNFQHFSPGYLNLFQLNLKPSYGSS